MAQSTPHPSEMMTEPYQEEEDYFEYFFDYPGSEPGTLWIEADAKPSEIVLIDYNPTRATRRVNLTPEQCRPALESDSVSWLDIQGLGSEEVLKQLAEVFHLHPLLLEDVVNVPQRPKVEDYQEQLLIIAHMVLPKADEFGFEAEQVSFVLGKKYLLTFQEEPNHDCFNAVRDRLRTNKGRIRKSGADYLAYLLLDAAIDAFFPVLEDYGERLDDLEQEVVFEPTRETLEKIYNLRRELLALRRAIWPQQTIINTLMRSSSTLVSSEVEIYFRDCYDHVIQLLDIIESYRELASNLMEVYLSSINNKMNDVMKLLTVISTIFIPLSFVASLYGMNFEYMPELQVRWAYFAVLGVMGAIATGLLTFFWSRGWLKSSFPTQKKT